MAVSEYIRQNSENYKYCEDAICLSSIKVNKEMQKYEGFKVSYNDLEKEFPAWENTTMGFEPEIQLFQDNASIFVLLTLETGTGMAKREIHILNADTLEEISVENAKSYILKYIDDTNVTESIEKDGIIHITHNGESIGQYKVPDDIIKAQIFREINWGRITSYEIKDGKLFAELSGFVSPSLYIGSLQFQYEYFNGEYVIAEVNFVSESAVAYREPAELQLERQQGLKQQTRIYPVGRKQECKEIMI